MKSLYVIRHAKSSWENVQLADIDRPLNDRGKKDAPRMAKRLKEKRLAPDLFLSSPVNRTLSTAMIFADILNVPLNKITTNKALYHASPNTLFSELKKLENNFTQVFLFGHNPGLTDFVNELMDLNIDNVPTCGIVACQLDITSWNEIGTKKGHLLFFDFPKNGS